MKTPKKNWFQVFGKIMKKNNFQDKQREKEWDDAYLAFQKFLNLPQLQTQMIAQICIFTQKKSNVKAAELMEAFDEKFDIALFQAGLQNLIATGWVRYESDGPFFNNHVLCLTHDAEVSLKTSDSSYFPHLHLSELKKQHLEIYARATLLRNREIGAKEWVKSCNQWLKQMKTSFAKSLKALKISNEEKAIAIYLMALHAQESEASEINKFLKPFASDPLKSIALRNTLSQSEHPLFVHGLLEKNTTTRGDVFLKPSRKWICQFLTGEDPIENETQLPASLIRMHHEEIIPRELMYNATLQEEVDDLHDIILPKNYNVFVQQSKFFRENAGVILMLSGGPGTGKTELAKQLARSSQRDLLYFDVSKQRNMYLGESEKALTEIFRAYAEIVSKSKNVPILFFNESDSLFSARSNGSNLSNTENAILTILLNELEKFNGILICTTNRPEAMDEAFHRRFLMHLRIEEPNEEIRYKLLISQFPQINPTFAQNIAKQYAFTAANLETYKQQNLLASIIQKSPVNIEEDLCKFFESICNAGNTRSQIGFNRQTL